MKLNFVDLRTVLCVDPFVAFDARVSQDLRQQAYIDVAFVWIGDSDRPLSRGRHEVMLAASIGTAIAEGAQFADELRPRTRCETAHTFSSTPS